MNQNTEFIVLIIKAFALLYLSSPELNDQY